MSSRVLKAAGDMSKHGQFTKHRIGVGNMAIQSFLIVK